jgi:nitrogen regulatory protein P-II 1
MQLLLAVINHAELVDDVLAGFVELGITGATVLESRGMGRVLSRDVPIFAGVPELREESRPENRTVLCVVSDEKADSAIIMIQAVIGSLEQPGAGIACLLPLTRVVGLARELGG